jgi:hypothetical protein
MNPTIEELKLSEIIFDEVIYPRKDHDPDLVQRYVGVLDEIEAKQSFMSVAADNKLLDGKHRWLAYRTKHERDGDPMIKVFRYPITAPHDQLKLAAKLNSEHGWQLSEEDKKSTAIALYSYGCSYDDIKATLSVGKDKVRDWLSRTVKEQKERRNARIFDLWLACRTQEEIAEAVGCDQKTATNQIEDLRNLVLEDQIPKLAAEYAIDFEPPIYNIWKQQDKTLGSEHFGNTEVRWLDNLLYLYTKPFDVIIDPFAGGGSTINVCKKRFRRYYVSDRKPPVRLESEIRKHDLTEGLPKPPQWKDVRLVYLDPPYWKQAEGKYSDDPTDLANMSLCDFNEELITIINGFAAKIRNGEPSYIALVISPTQYSAPDHEFTDHISDMLRAIKFSVDMRFSVPYESQQYMAAQVEWAKANRKCLVLTREIIVWKV